MGHEGESIGHGAGAPGSEACPDDRFRGELFQIEIGSRMRVLRFLRRILKRALADIGMASKVTAHTDANKVEQLHGGDYWQPR